MKKLEEGILEYKLVGEFLVVIKKEFEGGEEELMKVAELKKLEQGRKPIEEFVQESKRVARGSGYEEKLLVDKFKREINRVIRRKLIKAEQPPTSIEQ